MSTIYFDVDGGNEINRSDGSPYDLKIVLAYPPADDPDQTADDGCLARTRPRKGDRRRAYYVDHWAIGVRVPAVGAADEFRDGK